MTEHTIFNNTSAFGLMLDHLRDELRAHHAAGGKLEWYRRGKWQEIRPAWSSDAIYRAINPSQTTAIERKLAKAVAALRFYANFQEFHQTARAALAEIEKGGV